MEVPPLGSHGWGSVSHGHSPSGPQVYMQVCGDYGAGAIGLGMDGSGADGVRGGVSM